MTIKTSPAASPSAVMLTDTIRHGQALWSEALNAPTPKTPSERHTNTHLTYAAAYAFATVAALAALTEVDPARADEVARKVDATMVDGTAGEWLFEYAQTLAVES